MDEDLEITTETFGISAKAALCTLFNIPIDPYKYAHRINDKAHSMFLELYKSNPDIMGLDLTRFYGDDDSFNTEIISRSPHNFLTRDSYTVSIWTSIRNVPMICPKVVGQAGISTMNKVFGHLSDGSINRHNIKRLVTTKTQEMLEIFLDYLFISDISIFVFKDNIKGDIFDSESYEIEVINARDIDEISFDEYELTFTRNLGQWKESTTLKCASVRIGEFQIHKERFFKFRFFLKNLLALIKRKKHTNETLGATAEYAVCQRYNLLIPPTSNLKARSDRALIRPLRLVISRAFCRGPIPIQYTGANSGSRKGSRSSYDFLLQTNEELSLKTNHNNRNRICPPEIGQPSFSTFDHYFKHTGHYTPPVDGDKFKYAVMTHIDYYLHQYVKFLFDCDQMLWIFGLNKNLSSFDFMKLVDCRSLVSSNIFDTRLITFTQSLTSWNESNTVMYDGKSLGNFQVHTNRNVLKFRFQLLYLMEILNMH